MELAIMCFKRGKTIPNRVQKHPTMTLDMFKRAYRGTLVTPEQIAKDRVEMPGPDFQLWKTDRFYVAFKESN